MTSPGGLKVSPLYSFINEITTFFMITKKRANISSLNFMCIGIRRLWLHLYKRVFMTSLMTSPGHKVGQILKLIYPVNIWARNIYMSKNIFHGDDVIDDATGWPQSFPPYSCLVEVGSGSKLQGQCLINKCKYRNRLSSFYMSKENLYE